MADFQSKYSGEQVEALLDSVANGEAGGGGGGEGEVQKTTEAEITAMGFTKNLGTITEIKMNGVSKGTSGVVDLGTVITSHQDLSGKQDKLVSGENIKTVNGQSLLGNGDIVIGGCENLTYEEFVSKVNNSELVGGCLYRITDYETVVTGDYLTTASDHGFDLIVLATSSNSYSNKCWATPTDRYQYPPYPNCQLDKWQLWWSHERTNQIWVPEAGHKGVIYRMIDEWGNDCPYDFKSIMLKVPAFASDVNGTLGTVGSLADSYYPTFAIMIDSEIHDASVYLNSFEDDTTFCANNVIKSSMVDGYNDDDSSPFPYVLFLASCGDTYSDLSSKRIYNNVIGESTTGVLFFAECNYFNFSNNSIGKNSANIRLIARQDDLQNTGIIYDNNFKDNIDCIYLEASDISSNFINSGSSGIYIPTIEEIPRTPYTSITELYIGKAVSEISTNFGSEKQEYVYLSSLHVGDSSYDIHFSSSYGTPVDGFSTNIGKNCHGLYIDLTYSPTVNIGDGCTDITVNGICTIGDGCSSIEYISETGASQLTFNSGVHDLSINPLDGIKATVIAGSPTGSADDIVDQTVAKPENGPDNADYLLYVNGQNKWVAEPIMSLDKTVKYTEGSLRTIEVDLLNDGMVYALPLGSEEAKAEADCVLQEKIDDLDAIRSGAAKGATALQSIPSEYVTENELTNKGYATTSALNNKVDKVSGKQLSTEDFTSALKMKLEGLNNYDDTELSEALSTLRGDFDKLVSGDTTAAIKTFNEVIAFLDGVQDTQDLSSIIASIEQQIAAKQDKITDLETIRSGAAKGATALQSYTEKYTGTITGVSANGTSVATSGVANIPAASTSAYGVTKLSSATNSTSTTLAATASAVKAAYDLANSYKGTVTGVKINGSTKNPSNGVVDLGTVITSHQDISGKQDKLVSGTNIKTINGESILGEGDIPIKSGGKEYIIYDEQNNFPNEILFSEYTIQWHPNKVYVANTLIYTCAIYVGGIPAPTDIVGEYSIMFKTFPEDELESFSFPENWLWANGQTPEIKGDTHYELSVVASKLGEDYVYKAVLTPFTNIN